MSGVVKRLKRGTSRVLRGEFAGTVGKVEEATVQAYIREQRP